MAPIGFESEHECNLFHQAGSIIKGKKTYYINKPACYRSNIVPERGRDVIHRKGIIKTGSSSMCIKGI